LQARPFWATGAGSARLHFCNDNREQLVLASVFRSKLIRGA
jgi:hypothetical protein